MMSLDYEMLPITAIHPNPYQPHWTLPVCSFQKRLHPVSLTALSHPIWVTDQADDTYILLAGENTMRDLLSLDTPAVPVIVKHGDLALLTLEAHRAFQHLSPLEEAVLLQALLDQDRTHNAVAALGGMTVPELHQTLTLLTVCHHGRLTLHCHTISAAVARELLRLSILDAAATKPMAESYWNLEFESWADFYANHVLWKPWHARSELDARMAVDEYLDTLFLAGQRPRAGLKRRITNLRTRFLARKELTPRDHADNMLDLLQPDLQRLTEPQWAELQRAHALFWGNG